MSTQTIPNPRQTTPRSAIVYATAWSVKTLYVLLGTCLAAIGLVSIFLPLIPVTTTFLASSFFLSRSFPGLQRRIQSLPCIGNLIKHLDGTRIMTRKAQYGICAYLWINLIVTCACLYGIGLASYPIVSINFFCCVLSMIFIVTFHAEQTIVTKASPADRDPAGHGSALNIASNTISNEAELLTSVQDMVGEIKSSLGGLPFSVCSQPTDV